MKIVNRATFMTLPAGTVYCELLSAVEFGEFHIKAETIYSDGEPIDWFHTDSIVGWPSELYMSSIGQGEAVSLDLDGLERDGLFDDRQLYAVFELSDTRALIARLQQAVADAEKGGAQ